MGTKDFIERSSGNVFADLGFEAPGIELAKAELAHTISRIIEVNGWTQAEAAHHMAIDQPKVSALVRGRLVGFSVERLMRLLNQMNYTINLTVSAAEPNVAAGIEVRLLEPVTR
jgi:predicted XRE-type DNA-binding protein